MATVRAINKMSGEGLVELFDEIVEGLRQYYVATADTKERRELMRRFVEQFDELDEQDFFGTEGWRHTFGMD